MKISEEFARDYRDLTTRGPEDRGACPSSETLNRLARGSLHGTERNELLDHIVDCADCAVELRMAKDAVQWSAERSEATTTPGAKTAAPRSKLPWRVITAAAALLAVAIGLGLVLPGLDTDAPRLRGSVLEVTPAEGATLTQWPAELSWPAQPGAEAYRVTVLDDRGNRLWQGPWQSEPSVGPEWPAAVRGSYLWTVEVRGPADRSKLGPFVFHVSDSP